MKTVLITGASGFIGSHLADEAVQKGWKVLAGIRSTSRHTWLSYKPLYTEVLHLEDPTALQKELESLVTRYGPIHYVIHNAGITHAQSNGEFERINAGCTHNLTEAIRKIGGCEKFALIGSLAAMGPGPADSFRPITINDPLSPVSAYGRSKGMAEEVVKKSNLPHLILRPTAVYGPRDEDFLRFFKSIASGFEPVLGSHKQVVSMIHAEDVAALTMALLEKDGTGTFILSDGGAYDKSVIGTYAKKVLKKKTLRLVLPLRPLLMGARIFDAVYNRWGHRPFLNREKLVEISSANWLCDSTPAWMLTGLQPRYTLATGMEQTARWYQKNGWLPAP